MSDKEPGDRRRRLDSVIPELLKRAVEIGVEKAAEAPDNFKELVGGIKLPRELANYLLSQVEETKNGLVGVVAQEVREFLENTNISGEVRKVLTTVQFEISTTIRFRPIEPDPAGHDGGGRLAKPEVKADVQMSRAAHASDEASESDRAAKGDDDAGASTAEEKRRERWRSRE
jgi:hypothetical protein